MYLMAIPLWAKLAPQAMVRVIMALSLPGTLLDNSIQLVATGMAICELHVNISVF
jgi:hypothetical protein